MKLKIQTDLSRSINKGRIFFGPPEHGEIPFYVDSTEGNRLGTSDPSWRKQIIRYSVRDPLGNERVVDREVRIVDTTSPVIVLNEGTQGINFPNLQGGFSFKDPGATVTDNYDESVDLISTLLFKGKMVKKRLNSQPSKTWDL